MKKRYLLIGLILLSLSCKKKPNNTIVPITPTLDLDHTTTFIIDTSVYFTITQTTNLSPRNTVIFLQDNTPNYDSSLVSLNWTHLQNARYIVNLPTIQGKSYLIGYRDSNNSIHMEFVGTALCIVVNRDTLVNFH